jgi:hypothetical protein
MGGNLIVSQFGMEPKRLDKEAYDRLGEEVLNKIESSYPKWHNMCIIPSYYDKEDFGDLDVLIEKSPFVDYREFIKHVFEVDQISHNAGVYSFPYEGFQIDLITMDSRIWHAARAYFSWNDCGNLCGRCFHQLGLKYGHNGLTYLIRDYTIGVSDDPNGEVLGEASICVKPKQILEFGGFDYKQFEKGFNTLEEMFDWVARSDHFNSEDYDFDKLNHINRTRNRKRSSYAYFVEWLKENKQNYPCFTPFEDKRLYIPTIVKTFPAFQDDLDNARKVWDVMQENKTKFNAHLVTKWAFDIDHEWNPRQAKPLEGPALGKVIKWFKQIVTEDGSNIAFSEYLQAHSQEEIHNAFWSHFYCDYREYK